MQSVGSYEILDPTIGDNLIHIQACMFNLVEHFICFLKPRARVVQICKPLVKLFNKCTEQHFCVRQQYGVIDFVLFTLCDLLWTPHSGMWS